MAHAEKCPICNGSGKSSAAKDGFGLGRFNCHGCGGKGWVEISDEQKQFIQINKLAKLIRFYNDWHRVS